MSWAYGQRMNTKSSFEGDADQETVVHLSATDATSPSRVPSEGDADWQQAAGMHWHPYSATAETAARSDVEEHDRSSKPRHIASQSPDERGLSESLSPKHRPV